MKKLNAKQQKLLEQLQEELEKKSCAVEEAIAQFNDQITELWAENVLPYIEEYNDVQGKAQTFVEETREDMRNYYEERSDAWKEGDAGEEYYSWLDIWDNDLSELEDIEIEDIDVPDFGAMNELKEYPTEPG